jgi:hypothetical protein
VTYLKIGLFVPILATIGVLSSNNAIAQEMQQNLDSQPSAADQKLARREQPTWRFEIANDFMFDSDNGFTNGFSIQKHSTTSPDIDDLRGVRAFGKGLARRILPQRDGLVYRKGLRIGQNMATPELIELPQIILDDVPYHGLLAAESSWIAFDDSTYTGFGLLFGLVGEYSGAEAVQKAVHSAIDATDPEGWDNQLDHEPVINVYFGKKKKIWNTSSFDAALTFDAALGNYHTGINAGAEMRIGRKPEGFAVTSDPLGRSMSYDATLGRSDGRPEYYFSLAARAWAWAVFMPLEGNIFVSGNEWTDNNTIDPENVVGQGIAGFHFVWQSFGVHLTWTFQTDSLKEESLGLRESGDNDFGFLVLEWRFGG